MIESRFEAVPKSLTSDGVLKFAEIEKLQLSRKRVVTIGIESRILFRRPTDALINFLENVGRNKRTIANQRRIHDLPDTELGLFNCGIQFAELRRKIKPLFDEQVFDSVLNSALTLGDECFEVTWAKWIAE